MDRRSFYLGALLHDIGKFIERAKNKERQEKAKHWIAEGLTDASYAHRRYGADFVDEIRQTKPNLLSPEVVPCILFHHRGNDSNKQDHNYLGQDIFVKMIRIADSLASSERQENAKYTPQEYFKAKLLSIFSQVSLGQSKSKADHYLEIKKLTLKKEDIFLSPNTSQEAATTENAYRPLVDDFEREFAQVQNDIQLYHLLEKYLWAVPAQTPFEINGKEFYNKPDVSLFDHLRVTAAIALCLYDEHAAGNLNPEILFGEKDGRALPPFALLVNVDLSGIQSFIFDIPSKGAAKSLKGRSFYLQLLAEIIARHLIDRLDLATCNLLYDGGGNLFLLVPKCKEMELQKLRSDVVSILAEEHHGAIYAAIGWAEVAGKDFEDFGVKWKQAVDEAAKIKRNRFREIDYKHIFEPQAHALKHDFTEFTKKIRTAQAMTVRRLENPKTTAAGTPEEVFTRLGYEVKFHVQTGSLDSKEGEEQYIFNNTDFLPKFSGFKFSAINVPAGLEFDEMAEASQGDKRKLGLLKMDVDNLGKIFIHGLPKNERSISRLATLSRMFRLFFEGYLNTLRHELDPNNKKIYLVFAGGDDTFLFGSWNAVFDLAERIRDDFKAYVCQNDAINLSASLTLMHSKFPVIRAAEVAENALQKVKQYTLKEEQEASKNRIAILGEVFTWREFEYIKDFKNILLHLIDSPDASARESRALLQKVYNSTRGFAKLIEQTSNGKVVFPKFWRFAYYLRNMKSANKEQKEKLVEIYETLIKSQIYKPMNERVYNPMIIPVATRWAELATKKERRD